MDQGIETGRSEQAYLEDGLETYCSILGDVKPVFIVRNPVDRIWSCYRNFTSTPRDYEEFLSYNDKSYDGTGVSNIIEKSNYQRYIDIFLELQPIVYKFEEVVKQDNFPHLHNTSREMPVEFREMVQQKLDDAGIKY